MANLTFQQVESLWIRNGGPPAWAPTMAAVAIGGESRGDPTARNASGAEGVWQILISAQDPAFQAQFGGKMADPNENAKAAIALLGNGEGISNWEADPIGAAIVANGSKPLTNAQAQQYATKPPIQATLMSDVTKTPAAATPATAAAAPSLATLGTSGVLPSGVTPEPGTNVGTAELPAAEKGADVTNFMGSGIDLSAVPANELGNAENAVKDYIVDPGQAKALQQRIAEDFGYSGEWIKKIPQLYGILIWAATSMDVSDATDMNIVAGAITNTTWWKTTNQNVRSFQNAQAQNSATVAQVEQQAEEKVQATANQIGVTLSKQQFNAISQMYAANSYTPTNVLGSQSGTSQEWLDQAVIDAATTIKATGKLPTQLTTAGAAAMETPGAQPTGTQQTSVTSANPATMTGLAATLYQSFQQVAQNYLMYNTSGNGYLTSQNLLDAVNKALESYTGTGSSGLVSQFANNATAAFTQQMIQQASAAYGPTVANAIAGGTTTTQQYMAPQLNTIASTLGINSNAIELNTPQWSWLMGTPNAQGVKTPLTNDQILQKITQPNFTFQGADGQAMTYDQTDTAKQNATQVATGLSQMFGVGGT